MGSVAIISVDNGLRIRDGGNDCPPSDEARANAHLIAAAPHLLVALEELVSVWEHQTDLDCEHNAFVDAKAALAKALGKTA